MSGLLQRAVTAVFFVAAMLGGIFGGRYSFVILFALVTGLCLWEFLDLTLQMNNQKRDKVRKLIGLFFGMIPFVLISILKLGFINTPDDFILVASLSIFPLIFMAFVYELFCQSNQPFANLAFIVLGLVYIGIPFAMLDFIAFKDGVFNANLIFGILVLNWVNDTGAYLVGSQIGKTPLLPRISPKKTWEGSIGGAVIGLIFAFILSIFFKELTRGQWITLGAIVILFGSVGDLIESMLKRSFATKDTGTLLPGHGGFLDRFDAFIFSLPFATAYLLWIK